MPTPLAVYAEQKRQKREAERAAKAAAIAAATPAPVEPPAPVVVPPSELQVIRITEMLAAAQAELADAEEEHREASFVATTEPGQPAYQRLAAARRGLDEAKGKVNAVVAAMEVARQRAADALQQSVTLSHAQRVAAVQALLAERDDAVARLADALAEAVAAYDEVLKINGQVIETYPVGRVPLSAFLGRGEVDRAIISELYRLSAVPHRNGTVSAFPGAVCPDLRLAGNPKALPAMSDQLTQAGAFLVRELADAAPAPRPVTARPVPVPAPAPAPVVVVTPAEPTQTQWEVMASIPKQDLTSYLAAPAVKEFTALSRPEEPAPAEVVAAEHQPEGTMHGSEKDRDQEAHQAAQEAGAVTTEAGMPSSPMPVLPRPNPEE